MHLYVFPPSPNSRKVMTVNAYLGLGIPQTVIDLRSGVQGEAAHLARNPNGKVPVLELDDGTTLWESNAIIDHMAGLAQSDLWPGGDLVFDVLRWQFWETSQWTPALSKFLSKHLFGNDSVDIAAAETDTRKLAAVLDGHLAGRDWLVGTALTTADISVGAMLCYRDACHYPLDGFTNIAAWIARLEGLEAWGAVNMAPTGA